MQRFDKKLAKLFDWECMRMGLYFSNELDSMFNKEESKFCLVALWLHTLKKTSGY